MRLLLLCGVVTTLGACSAGDEAREAVCSPPAAGVVSVPAGEFLIGTNARYTEEGPARTVRTDGFWIDAFEVTNAQFGRFVAETGYVTLAERTPDPADHPEIDPDLLTPGSAVFGVDVRQGGFWWSFVPGAHWRAPHGPGSTIEGMGAYPVVHVTFEDAAAYAAWAGGRLPNEAEWEIVARGGLQNAEFAWGDEFRPDGQWRANTWQGPFPALDVGDDGHAGLAPVGCYEATGYGVYDIAGNVWEWTSSPFDDTGSAGVIRGGSFLCAPSYCVRYRPPARQPQEWDFSSSHIGFRVVYDSEPATGEAP
ncbi:MAG: formylglycine-generating enzyme family protein [Pseudomonadota bacterium]